MDLAAFQTLLSTVSIGDIRSIVRELDAGLSTVAGEIETTQAIIAAEEAIRRHRCRQDAAVAGRRASETVVAGAHRAGIEQSDVDVIRVARAAGQYARALVVQHDPAVALGPLSVGFRNLSPLPIGA